MNSPKLALENYYEAITHREYAKILECIDPAIQTEYDRTLYWMKRYENKAIELQALIRKKFGPEICDRFIKKEYFSPFEEPLYGAGKSGYLDWTRIKEIPNLKLNIVELEVDGEPITLAVRKVNGKWYISIRGLEYKYWAESLKHLRKMLKRLYNRDKSFITAIQNGKINKENIESVLLEGKECPGVPTGGKLEVKRERVPVCETK